MAAMSAMVPGVLGTNSDSWGIFIGALQKGGLRIAG
jgi:hypothetical protein